MSSPQSPETRGAWLWRKMMQVYGARFLDMWEGVDVKEMQATWSDGLRGVARENLIRGIAALYHTKHVPTLPEFIELCKPVPAMYRQNTTLALTDQRRSTPEEAREQLGRIRDLAQSILREGHANGSGIEWAHRLLRRAANGEHVTIHQITSAKDAIEAWERTHGRIRDREPGCDDNEEFSGDRQ